jgi:hypothetical protein
MLSLTIGCGKKSSVPPVIEPWWLGKHFVVRGHVYDDSTLVPLMGSIVTIRSLPSPPQIMRRDTTDQRGFFYYYGSVVNAKGDVLATDSLYLSDSLSFQFTEQGDSVVSLEFYLKRRY